MTTVVFGDANRELQELLVKYGFVLTSARPDFVVSFGGDGTLIRSEAMYPGIPKVVLRNSKVCKKCAPMPNEVVLAQIAAGKFTEEKLMKLELRHGEKRFQSLNDVMIHNGDPRQGMRYRLAIDGVDMGREMIGDGIIVATPFGSTAYYRSITDSSFEVGIGLAFNNSTEPMDHMVLREDREITLTVSRGPALAYADQNKEMLNLREGDVVHIVKAPRFAHLWTPLLQ